MKSFNEHLKSVSTNNIFYKKRQPVLRASAIFPCLINKSLDTKILFMGYWMLKKKIKSVTLFYKLRDQNGKLLLKKKKKITQTKSYFLSIKKLIPKKKITDNFVGSIELEFLSKKDLTYPFPACVINFDYKNGSSFVHTTGRTYNNMIDLKENSKIKVPESGFDIIPNLNFYPFLSFVNGPKKLKNQFLKIKVINFKNEYFIKNINLGTLRPFETKFIKFLNKNEKYFLMNKKGTAIIEHNLSNFYPRLLVGNCKIDHSEFSITHSYYDSKNIKEYFINKDKKEFFDSILTVPVFKDNYTTEICFYPIYCKMNFNINLEVFDPNGNRVLKKNNIYNMKKNSLKYININSQLKKINLNKFKKKYFIAKLSFSGEKKIPSRLKFGLNISSKKNSSTLSSNVCFNAQIANKNNLFKKTRFCWTPIINKNNSKFIIYNTSFVKKGFKKACIQMNFWREKDQKSISKQLILNDNGSYLFNLNNDKIIKKFLCGSSGWVTFKSDNPFINGYYLEVSKQGNIGADHFF